MKALLKNWLSLINDKCFFFKKQKAFICLLFFPLIFKTQIANYVSNGSFEQCSNCSTTPLTYKASYWETTDSIKFSYLLYSSDPPISIVPNMPTGYQQPRTGHNLVLSEFYCDLSTCSSNNSRGYLRNRLKQNLQAGKTYCAKYHIVNTNNSPLGIKNFGIYFGNVTLDTIHYCNLPLTYLIPQIENTTGVITDTLNWIPITGTFVATGNEKYMVLGNFKSNAATNTLLINPASLPQRNCDIYIDDVSVIELTLPAYAGPDIYGIPTTTVYLGRPQDIGIDEACMWYHLPNNTTAIDTAAGITITVAATTQTYMVKQDICGIIKYDTVVVYASAVGINELLINNEKLKIYPNPSDKNITLELDGLTETEFKLKIFNNLNQLVREEDILIKGNSLLIKTDELKNGVYLLNLKSNKFGTASKRFIIAR